MQNTLKEKFRDSIRPIIDQLEKNVLEVKSIVAQSTSLWNVRENLKNSKEQLFPLQKRLLQV